MGPIRRVAAYRLDADTIAAAARGYGAVAEAAQAAHADLAAHLTRSHGYPRAPRLPLGHRRLCFTLAKE